MPSVSKKQKRFMGAELGRLRAGEPTSTGMKEGQLEDFAAGPSKGLPETKKPPKHHSKKHQPFGGPGMKGAGRQVKPRGGSFY